MLTTNYTISIQLYWHIVNKLAIRINLYMSAISEKHWKSHDNKQQYFDSIEVQEPHRQPQTPNWNAPLKKN